MPFNIVLIEPEIPTNTGNIGRLSLAANCHLHLVKPFGFELSDKRVKRAGLDYWKHVSLHVYENAYQFFNEHRDKSLAFFSSHANKMYYDLNFDENQFLIFGKESVGLGDSILQKNKERAYKIPLLSEHIRSLNLANAVGVVVYEGLRQLSK